MFKRLDRSRVLSSVLDRISSFLSRQSGVPVIIGIALVFLGMIAQVVGLLGGVMALAVVGILLNGIGTLTALIGLLLGAPFGR